MAFRSRDLVPESKRDSFITLAKVLRDNCSSDEIKKLSGLSRGHVQNICDGRNPNFTYMTAGKIVAGYKKYKESLNKLPE